MRKTYANIINKTVLVGLSFTNSNDEVIERKQLFGKIVSADKHTGISILIDDTEKIFKLPPDLSSLDIATPGEYSLRSTEKVVVNPDFISTWFIRKPDQSS